MKYTISHYRWSGIRNIVNQDSLMIHHVKFKKREAIFVAVADGIGSLTHSEEASGYCLKSLSEWFYEIAKDMIISGDPLDCIELSLQEWIKKMQLYLADFQRHNNFDFGTTLTGLLCIGSEYLLVHIGDSKGLLLSNKSLFNQIVSFFLKERTRISVALKTYDNIDTSGKLTACIGMSGEDKAFFFRGKLNKKSMWLIGTDGILSNNNIPFIKKSFGNFLNLSRDTLQFKLEALGRNAVSMGSKDNMAIVGVIIK